MRYGLKWGSVRLMQISGSGRVRLEQDGREWWDKPPKDAAEVYETDIGQTWPDRDMALKASMNLTIRR